MPPPHGTPKAPLVKRAAPCAALTRSSYPMTRTQIYATAKARTITAIRFLTQRTRFSLISTLACGPLRSIDTVRAIAQPDLWRTYMSTAPISPAQTTPTRLPSVEIRSAGNCFLHDSLLLIAQATLMGIVSHINLTGVTWIVFTYRVLCAFQPCTNRG